MSYFGPAATNVPFLLQSSKIMLPFKNKREKGPNNLSRYLLLSFLSVAGNCSFGICSMATYYQASRMGWVRCDYFQGIEIEGETSVPHQLDNKYASLDIIVILHLTIFLK